jgi:hypothetical protein
MVAFPAVYELSTVQTGDQAVVFQLTADDVLWTARAAAREAASEAAITTWVFTQRAVLAMLKGGTASYTSVLRAFSQPINPIWARDGSMCRVGGPYAGKPECSEDKLQARDWYTHATWDQLDAKHPNVTAIVAQWAKGLLPNAVPRVTNFAAPAVAQSFLERNPGARLFYKGDNWYIVDPGAVAWPDAYVRMVSPTGFIATAAPLRPQTIFAAIAKGVTDWWRVG